VGRASPCVAPGEATNHDQAVAQNVEELEVAIERLHQLHKEVVGIHYQK
jgi:hypothetical protein